MTKKKFKENLAAYADLLLTIGLNIKSGEHCLIQAFTVHRELALACARAAYAKGAAYVNILYLDEQLDAIRLEHAPESCLDYFPPSIIKAYEEIILRGGVFLSLTGRENLNADETTDARRGNRLLLARAENLYFFHEKVRSNALRWCVAASATAAAAKKMFSRVGTARAVQNLWDVIFDICRVTTADPTAAWRVHLDKLDRIKRTLNGLKIRELLYKGPHAELRIGLAPQARWQGGESLCKNGERFVANIPTEEVFSAPDFHKVNGWVECSRPLVYRNFFIEQIRLEFKDGILTRISGSRGIKELEAYLFAKDENRRLGEVALVESSSPVYKSGHVFHNLLYDENAASHIAFGSAFTECFEGIESYNAGQKEQAGFNTSKIHIDLLIGSPELEVSARLSSGRIVPLLSGGEFVRLG
jgi:aminopeptidase